MIKSVRHTKSVLLSGAALTTVCTAAAAQPADTIVVTAQKREQTISEVPISLVSLDSEFLDKTGTDGFDEVANLTPNFSFLPGFDRSEVTVNVRGLTSGTSNPGIDPSVGFFLDGIYIARPAALTSKLTDIDRLEILRGPQGTLYGRNTSAGAVNIYTKNPGDEFEANLFAGYGNFDTVDLRGRIAGPLGENISASLSGYWGRSDSFLDDSASGEPIGENEDFGGRIKVRFEPCDTFNLTLAADYSESNTDASTIVGPFQKNQADLFAVFGAAMMNPALGGFVRAVENVPVDNVFDRETSRTPGFEQDDLEQYGFSAEANWDIGFATITSLTGYRESEDFARIDPDLTLTDLFRTSVENINDQFSQELRLASNEDGDPFEYLVGLYYFDASFTADTQTEFGVPLFGQFNAMMPPNPITQAQSANSVASQDVEAFAVFGQLSYNITDALKLTYGFRYNNEEKSSVINQNPDPGVNSTSGIPFPLQFPVFLDLEAEVDDEDFINMVSLNYQFGPNSNVYATYSEGLKSGGINASILLNTNGLTFEKETSKNYEIGYRNTLDNGLRYNIAAFYMTFQNLQVQTFDPTNPANIIVTNAGEAEIFGVEADAVWSITDNIDLNGAVAYNNSEYVDTAFPGTMTAQNPALPGIDLQLPATVDVSGETLSRAPVVTASVGAQYTVDLTEGIEASLRGDYSFTGSQFLDATLAPESEIDSYHLVNLRAGISDKDGSWSLTLFADNVFDEDYFTQLIASPGAAGLGVNPQIATFLGVLGAPRTFGVELRKNF